MRLEEIKKAYDITDDESLTEIKVKLKGVLKEMHPDNNEGECDINSFVKVMEDLKYIEDEIGREQTKKELMDSTSTLMGILRDPTIMELYSAKERRQELQVKLEKSVEQEGNRIKTRFRTKKYSLAGISGVITFLWLFPQQIMEHPLVQALFENVWQSNLVLSLTLTVIWLYVLCFTVIFWMHTARIENVEKQILENIKIESIQNKIFMNFIFETESEKIFSKQIFMNYIINDITEMVNVSITRNLKKIPICEDVAQNIADVILQRAEEHGIIRKTDGRSLIDTYEILV